MLADGDAVPVVGLPGGVGLRAALSDRQSGEQASDYRTRTLWHKTQVRIK